jgi:pimeloyl-ACP methyl ester carboxylesterase
LVAIDDRGTGLSDPVALSDLPSLEVRMDDLRTVLDTLQIERATLFGSDDGGPLALLFAVTYPERVDRLILFGTYAALSAGPDYPIGFPPEALDELATRVAERWRSSFLMDLYAPDAAPETRQWLEQARANSASPGQAEALFRRGYLSDVRPVLVTIAAPTLVLHRRWDKIVPLAMGRYLAERIGGARLVELDGRDHLAYFGDYDALVAEIEEFLTGERSAYETDRVLATVLFTDIVDSTKRAAAFGDRRWRQLLDEHDAIVQGQLQRFRGRAIKSTGDGFLATFDGPARAMRCAGAIRDDARQLGLEIRAGLHTGECEVRGGDLSGIAVHTAARVAGLARSGEILVSSVIPPLVAGSGIEFIERGDFELKGMPGTWKLFAVAGQQTAR